MALGKQPVFRKTIVSWYDSDAVCGVLAAALFGVLLFGVLGVSVAISTPRYHHALWVPIVLIVLSGGVMVSVLARLLKRFADRFK